MELLRIALQLIVALGILNVWLLRVNRATPFRGSGAVTMRQEFAVYGLSFPVMCVIGGLKVLLALALLVGIFLPGLTRPAALGLGILMLGAFAMHLKVNDPFKKSLPAISVLLLCCVIAFA